MAPYQQKGSQELPNSLVNIANPMLMYLQQQYNIYFMLSDIIKYITMIANNEEISFETPPNNYILTDSDKSQFLSYVGNFVGLPIFALTPPTGFKLDFSQLDFDAFEDIPDPINITSQQYANCLLARFYKFYRNCSLNNIINSIQKVSQLPLSDITVTVVGSSINFYFNTEPGGVTQAFLEYLDMSGYNLWMKPTYGTITFTYL
jgi:hypothetical protein